MRARFRMRRPARAWTVEGAIACAAATLLLAIGLTAHALNPVPPPRIEDRVPQDLLWPLILSCNAGSIGPIVNLSYDQAGRIDISVGIFDDRAAGSIIMVDDRPAVDEAASARLRECLSSYRLETRAADVRATSAERLLIYDWTMRWEAPCLSGHGFPSRVPDVSAFIDTHQAPWYLLTATREWQAGEFDVDRLLAARRACAPVPPFLAAKGVGW